MKTVASIAGWIVSSCFSTELLGYWLHRLLHSGVVAQLSRKHMTHHLVIYGPLDSQRSRQYLDATKERASLGNIGLEWLVPVILLIGIALGIFRVLHVRPVFQLIYFAATLSWSFLMFSYLHDVMHVEGFWLARNPWLRRWFVSAQNLHDIHHQAINDQGLMNKNFGIGFFFFDRLFGTFLSGKVAFNRLGYQAALRRFQPVSEET